LKKVKLKKLPQLAKAQKANILVASIR
jgi:hypothetical protein